MGNPVINEITAGANYQVTDSVRVYGSLELTMIFGPTVFNVTFPDTAAPTILLERGGGGSVALTVPAATQQTDSSIPSRVVRWFTFDGGGVRTLEVEVEDTSFLAVNEAWTLKVSGLPAAITLGLVDAGSTNITQIEADPVIEILTPVQNQKENQSATVQARARRNTLPLPAGPGCAGVTLAWNQDGGDSVAAPAGPTAPVATFFPGGAPGCQGTATVNIPGLTATVTLNYIFSATIGDFSNSGTAVINATPRTRHTVLAVDRSGSMSGSKWDNAVIGAYIWLDLFDAFREGINGDDHIGILVFEDNACTFRAVGAPDDDVEIAFPAPGALGTLPVLPAPGGLPLGSPGDCTPIGDALIRSLDRMVGLPGIPAENLYTILLLTDGYENAGTVRVDKEIPPPLVPGVEIFDSIKSAGPRSIFQFAGLNKNVRFYAVGVGATVQEDVLDDLAYGDVAVAGGYYRLVNNVAELVPAFGEMLAHNLGAQRQLVAGAPTSGADPAVGAGLGAYFDLPAGEQKLVVVLVLDAAGDQMELSWRSDVAAAFQLVDVAAVSFYPRPSHVIGVVDLNVGGLNASGTQWRVQRKPGGGGAALAIDPNKVLAARDLRVAHEIVFDRDQYRTGQPMKIEARLRAGGQPITEARVVVELARPGESLGHFLATNSHLYQGGTGLFNRTPNSTVGPFPGSGQGGDPLHPKPALLQYLLKQKEMEALPILTPSGIFVDGTDELFDDGVHGDGAAKDGNFANTFANTDKEGTYTFRFTISGRTPDGSRFADTITLSRWVGINVDPAASPVTIERGLPAEKDWLVAQVFVKPQDSRGQLLGPFRASQIQFTATAGAFQGDVITHPDGRYSRLLLYRPGQNPQITVKVQGKSFKPVSVEPGRKPREFLPIDLPPDRGCLLLLLTLGLIGLVLVWLRLWMRRLQSLLT